MLGFTGTFRLIRLALRRDRVKLPAWILALATVFAFNVPAVTSFYGNSIQDRINYAANMAPSMAGRIFGGPINGPDIGAIVINEVFLFTAIAVIFMSTLAVIRHTRQNEETGRSELIGSTIIGRNASLGAALIVTIGANIVLSSMLGLVLVAEGLPVAGSVGMAAALGAIGIIFAGIAAITAQVSESARGANSMAAIVLGVSFVIRAVGDSLGDLDETKMRVVSSWISWLSPLGWTQQIHPFTEKNWDIFALLTGFFVVIIGIAFYLNNQRDLGRGMVSARKGPANASHALLSIGGLARRLQRGIFYGWSVFIVIMGVCLGLISKEFENMLTENSEVKDYLANIGGTGSFQDIYFSAMIAIMGIVIAGYVVQALQRLRSEESSGQLEGLLATRVSKPGWMLSHITYVFSGAIALLLLLGLSTGLSYIIVTDAGFSEVWRVTWASLAQAPPILTIGGLTVAAFGLFPRAVIAVSWSLFAGALVISQFGALLKLPQLFMNLSPFSHLASMPAQPIKYLPLTILTGIALTLTIAGLVFFRQRNVTTA
jgi:ABC-2 type transport system permease protein